MASQRPRDPSPTEFEDITYTVTSRGESYSMKAPKPHPSTLPWIRDAMSNEELGTVKSVDSDIATLDLMNVSWWQCGMLMIAETISLGIMGLPKTLSVVGLVPGVLLIIGIGLIATYTGWLLGQFRLAHPSIHNMGDAFEIVGRRFGPRWGRVGKEIGGIGQFLFMLMLMGSHILTWIIAIDEITGNKFCNIMWGAVGMFLFFGLDLPRTLKNMSHLSVASAMSIGTAVIITMAAVATERKPADFQAPTLFPHEMPAFYAAFMSISNIIFAYAGHAAYFQFIAELKDPREFPKSLALLQIVDMILYSLVAIVTYWFAGQGIKSPALSSTSPLMQKISYGIAIPTIIIAGVIYGHINAKYIFKRLFHGTDHMTKRTMRGTIVWIIINAVMWFAAWIVAESIPHFDALLGLIASLFGSMFSFAAPAIFWLFENGFNFSVQRKTKTVLTIINILIVLMGVAILGLGSYSSIYSIVIAPAGELWSCGFKN